MIYTVTFNPALDYVVNTNKFNIGAINRTTQSEVQIGGKGINVSTVLHNLGFESIALGFCAGFTGKHIENGLLERGIRTDFIFLSEGLSRINVKIKSEKETEINASGPLITQDALNQLFEKLMELKNGDTLVLAGSVPSSMPQDIYEKIMEKLKDKDITIVVDATKKLLVNVLQYSPFLIKPNNLELGEIFGKELTKDEEIIEHAKKLQDLGARNVLVSMASKGAILVDENKKSYKIGVPEGKIVNSVGAGDSMVAGFIAGYINTKDYSYALKMGTATGSATAFSKGLASKKNVLELLEEINNLCIFKEGV